MRRLLSTPSIALAEYPPVIQRLCFIHVHMECLVDDPIVSIVKINIDHLITPTCLIIPVFVSSVLIYELPLSDLIFLMTNFIITANYKINTNF